MINKKYEIAVSSNFKASVNEDGSKIFIERRFDFKDGDFVVTETNSGITFISIFKGFINNRVHTYCDVCNDSFYNDHPDNCLCEELEVVSMKLASGNEIENMLERLEKENLVWDKENFILITIPKRGDLCIFWDDDKCFAFIDVFLNYNKKSEYCYETYFYGYKNTIPFNIEKYKEMIKFKNE